MRLIQKYPLIEATSHAANGVTYEISAETGNSRKSPSCTGVVLPINTYSWTHPELRF